MREPTAFELLADELRRSLGLSPVQLVELSRIFSGFGGVEIRVPAARRQRTAAALDAARGMVAQGLGAAVIAARLMGNYGASRAKAYRIAAVARGQRVQEEGEPCAR
jgi:hypothetical protein